MKQGMHGVTGSPTQRDGGGDAGLPVITVAVVILTVLVQAWPGLPAALQFERAAIAGGQWWRVLTGHLTHWSAGHLFWDLAAFAVLGRLCERRGRGRFVVCLLVSAGGITAAFHFLHPELTAYRGLSGVDSALFGLAVTVLWREARRRDDCPTQWLFGAAALLFCAKIAYEIGTRSFVFVANPDGRMTPVPVVHAVGFLIGAACALGVERPREPNPRSSQPAVD